MKKTVLNVNIAEFLAEYFSDITGAEDEFSYGLFWDTVVADRYNGEKLIFSLATNRSTMAVSITNTACFKPRTKWKPSI